MKTVLKTMLALAAVMPFGEARAEVIFTGKKLASSVNFINEKFSSEKQTRLFSDYYEDGSTTFTIMDEEFNTLKTFSTPVYQTVTAKYYRSQALQGPKGIQVEYSEEYPWVEGITKNAFIEMCAQEGATRTETRDGEVWCTFEDPYRYYYYDVYGFQYPEFAFVWRDGASFQKDIRYSYNDWGPTGDYGEPYPETDSSTPSPCDMYPYDATCSDLDEITLTQTLFNTDADYEWIVPVYEAIDCSYTNEYEKVDGTMVLCTGFKIESENGSTVTEFEMPTGFCVASVYPDLFIMGDKNYLLVEIREINDMENYYSAVFEIDPRNASVKMVGAPMKVSVDPTIPVRGMTVNVDLGTPAEDGCKVIVTSVGGKTVLSEPIQPGTMGTTIDTGRFEKGMYIVTVADGKTVKEHTKIIIR